MKKMTRIGQRLLSESKTAILSENDKMEKSSWKSKDLLSLLVRANMATDLPASQRMSDEDVLSREAYHCYFEEKGTDAKTQRCRLF